MLLCYHVEISAIWGAISRKHTTFLEETAGHLLGYRIPHGDSTFNEPPCSYIVKFMLKEISNTFTFYLFLNVLFKFNLIHIDCMVSFRDRIQWFISCKPSPALVTSSALPNAHCLSGNSRALHICKKGKSDSLMEDLEEIIIVLLYRTNFFSYL